MTDFFKCLQTKKKLFLRNPSYVRPWQHIFDVLNGYFMVTEKCFKDPLKYSCSWNFGPDIRDLYNVNYKILTKPNKQFIPKTSPIKDTE